MRSTLAFARVFVFSVMRVVLPPENLMVILNKNIIYIDFGTAQIANSIVILILVLINIGVMCF